MADDRNWKVATGLTAIIDRLGLKIPYPVVRSEIVAGTRKTIVTPTQILEQYPRIYQPPDNLVGQVRFALRYEPMDLRVYKAAFQAMEKADLELWIQSEPNGIFARRAWYLYELFTGKKLNVPDLESGRYIDLLDEEIHIVGAPIRVKRQRVFDNLLGNKDYCPLIRRTEKLKTDFNKGLAEQAKKLVSGVDPGVLKRAVHYLFTKETKSSFAIEGETPSKDRTERFVAALMRAEKFDPVQKHSFIELQNAIVDPRYAQKDWREVQVFIGSIAPDYSQEVHFICPKPGDVGPLMTGWMRMMDRLLDPETTVHPVCAAAAAAFGFVFVHPFLDGNGRIHRFLVHNVLARRNFTPEGVLFPVSAAMLREMSAYDRALENFSTSIQPFIQYSMNAEEQVEVANETADLYRFFDATAQTEYLFECIEDAIRRDLRAELDFLKFRDAAVKAVMEIVDMPNQRAALLVRAIQQSNGKFTGDKRQQFAELTDEEIGKIVSAIQSLLRPQAEAERVEIDEAKAAAAAAPDTPPAKEERRGTAAARATKTGKVEDAEKPETAEKAESSGEPSGVETAKVDPEKAEPVHPEPAGVTEAEKTEKAEKVESLETAEKVEPSAESSRVGTANSDPGKAEPVHAEPVGVEPSLPEPLNVFESDARKSDVPMKTDGPPSEEESHAPAAASATTTERIEKAEQTEYPEKAEPSGEPSRVETANVDPASAAPPAATQSEETGEHTDVAEIGSSE